MKTENKLRKKIDKYMKKLAKIKKRDGRRRSPKNRGSLEESVVSVPASAASSQHSRSPEPSQRSHSPEPSHPPSPNQDPEPENPFFEALNMDYEDVEKFEGNIHSKISTDWKHILLNGLKKEDKENILSTYKMPKNCTLLEAPALNDEVKNILTDSAKSRDRALESMQSQLGMATAITGEVMTHLIQQDAVDPSKLLKKLSDATKLLNDINYSNTRTRKILISPLLDKNFNNLVDKIKRDEYLYGNDLAVKIKTNQEIIKSSTQIRKTVARPLTTKPANVKPTGNRYGPPQTQSRLPTRTAAPRGGPRTRGTHAHPPTNRLNTNQSRSVRATPRGAHTRR